MKVKLIESKLKSRFERDITLFIRDKDVYSINYSRLESDNAVVYSALIIYK